jgi:putative phosphoserine phosphatase/1-acylglycerol-3-phosphate O-acyltransferase
METIFSSESNSNIRYIVFFDLDQTLAKSISGRSLAREAYKKGIMKNRDLVRAVILSVLFRLKLKDPSDIIDRMVSWVKGMPEKTLKDLCYEVAHKIIIPSIYEEAKTEINLHKAANAKIVILSSALTDVCTEIETYLNLDDIICSELEIKNGYLTGEPFGHLCYGEEKEIRLKAYCKKYDCSPSEAWYYGDSISDLCALIAVGNPVCVNPDNNLKRTAIKRGWKILSWDH